MKNQITAGNWEGISILLVIICTQIFMNLPRTLSEYTGTAGWLLAIYTALLSFILILLIVKLYGLFDGKDILDIAEYVAGIPGRIISGIIIILFAVIYVSLYLREFSENMKIIAFNLSPISFISLFFIAGMVTAAYCGMGAVLRVSSFLVPVIIAGFLFIVISISERFEISKIMPLMGLGAKEIFLEGISKVSIYSGILFMFVVSPFFKKKQFKRIIIKGLIVSSLFIVLSSIVYLLVYQYPVSTENFLPMYQLSRLINIGRFFQRIESVFLIIWGLTAMIYLSFGLNIIILVIEKTFELKYSKPLIPVFAILLLALSLVPENLLKVIQIETEYVYNYSFIPGFGLVLLLMITGYIKTHLKKKGG